MRVRVISQNGAIDVPYEFTAFHSCNGRIRMNMAGDTGRGTEMAVYSTQEKALAVMQTLHKEYVGCNTVPSIKGSNGPISVTAYVRNAVFRFPADDEVEL